MTRTTERTKAEQGTATGRESPQQQVALSMLLAEMTALSAMIPGLKHPPLRSEAEVEADFDNMPV
ncbi:hypothetical protein G5B31_19505 [Rhodobacter sp. SGA-6-6]|uniref:hypothetical protein n=1 Tax=Rhodobacter sp. SGA-6-6 TaxID=2710882 RepID=UPI0013EB429C|nr:hypothetical protein [Rhodobacter sp. SGA-6-6]NGM47724.1 hypothetical protein [Rhodobacter sp. SGA-6-6]